MGRCEWLKAIRFPDDGWLRAIRRPSISRAVACLLALIAIGAIPAVGQVFEMTGGASTLYRAEGGSLQVHGSDYTARVDLGVFGQPRLGFLFQIPFRGLSWSFGDQPIPFALSTDLFNPSFFLYARGVSALRKEDHSKLLVFAGATSSQFAAPFISVARADTPAGLVFYERKLRPALKFSSQNVVSKRQTSIQALEWTPAEKTTVALAAGIGSNQPYGAASLRFDRHWIAFRGSYAAVGSSFQRIRSASTLVTESDRENLRLDLMPTKNLGFSLLRQNLLSPSFPKPGPSTHATVNGVTASASGIGGFQFHSSLFTGESRLGRSQGTLWGVRRGVGSRIDAGVDVFHNKFGRFVSSTTSALISERLTGRLALTQVITRASGQTSVSYGGGFSTNLLSVGVNYLNLFVPFGLGGRGGFRQAMQVSVRFQLRNMQFNVSPTVDPLGRIAYTAYGTGYAYGSAAERLAHGVPGTSLPRYVIQGRVVDDKGEPVAGAAIRIDGAIVFSDSDGNVSLREGKARTVSLEVLFDQFMFPGRYHLVSAPRTVIATREEKAAPFKVVLRRSN